MKRTDIIARLSAAGLTFTEGGNHTKVWRDGQYVSAVPRHCEIPENLVRAIQKQTGVTLK
jgi:HicA toxin of bacterial toxin-antitoxin,